MDYRPPEEARSNLLADILLFPLRALFVVVMWIVGAWLFLLGLTITIGIPIAIAILIINLVTGGGGKGDVATVSDNQEERPVVPPPGFRATVPAEFPEVEEARLRQLALEPADLPPGFELVFEDADESEGVIYYTAHYALSLASEEAIESHTPLLADVGVLLFDDEAEAKALLAKLMSARPQQWEQGGMTMQHWPAEDMGFEQVDIRVRQVPCREFGDGAFALEASETIRDSVTGWENTLVDVAIYVRVDRAIGMVDLSAWGKPPPMTEVEALAEKLELRLATGFR